MRRLDVVYAVLTNEDKSRVLVVKNTGRDTWSLPGGTVEIHETLQQAVIREVKEETGYEIEVFGIMYVNEAKFAIDREHIIFTTFRGQIIGGEMRIDRPDEISEVQWIPLEQVDAQVPYYRGGLSRLIRLDRDIPYDDQGQS